MEITLPNNLRSNIDGYQSLIKLFNQCKGVKSTNVFFNCKFLSFIEANLCSLLGCIIEVLKENKCEVEFIHFKKNVEQILLKNGFLDYHFKKGKIYDVYGTTVSYKSIHKTDNDEDFEVYILEEVIGKKNFPRLSEGLTEKVLMNIFEVYVNAKTHGECNYIHSCGQFFPNISNKPLRFTIVDLGKNIKEKVNVFLEKNLSAGEAIRWAMTKGNTTKTDEPGGLGLYYIFDFIKLNEGKIEIISSNGFFTFHNGETTITDLQEEFSGTIVNFTFTLSDKKSYKLKQE